MLGGYDGSEVDIDKFKRRSFFFISLFASPNDLMVYWTNVYLFLAQQQHFHRHFGRCSLHAHTHTRTHPCFFSSTLWNSVFKSAKIRMKIILSCCRLDNNHFHSFNFTSVKCAVCSLFYFMVFLAVRRWFWSFHLGVYCFSQTYNTLISV